MSKFTPASFGENITGIIAFACIIIGLVAPGSAGLFMSAYGAGMFIGPFLTRVIDDYEKSKDDKPG